MTTQTAIDPALYPHIDLTAMSSRVGLQGTPRYVCDKYGALGDTDTGLYVPALGNVAPSPVPSIEAAAATTKELMTVLGR